MTVIIGGGSNLIASSLLNGGTSNGVISVNFDLQATVERLWSLGSWLPYDSSVTKSRTLSATIYGKRLNGTGGTKIIPVPQSTSCADASTIGIQFSAAVCTGGSASFTDNFFITSYSYTKDYQTFGQESWAFQTKPIIDSYTGTIYMLRGIPTGKMVAPGTGILTDSEMGIAVSASASQDSLGNWIESEAGSVSAGFPGIGNFDISREIVATHVGSSIGKKDGFKGNCSVSIPVQHIFL